MFEGFTKTFVRGAIERSAENALDRRRFLRVAGLTGVGVTGVGALGAGTAFAGEDGDQGGPSDAAVLNFALNLEYLEAEFYLRAVTGEGLPGSQVDGVGTLGGGLEDPAGKISAVRDSLDGSTDLDQGIVDARGHANIVPTDDNGIAFSRTPGQVLNIAYLNPESVTSGGFFPDGVNGEVNASADNG